jgi:hypothetical protein
MRQVIQSCFDLSENDLRNGFFLRKTISSKDKGTRNHENRKRSGVFLI